MKDIRKFLQEIPKKEIARLNEEEIKRTDADYKAFVEHTNQGLCYNCKKPLDSFDKDNPCFHWLLRPSGLKKKLIINFLSRPTYGYFRINSYLRWLANTKLLFAHIKDGDIDNGYVFQTTIKYKNIEWSLSCSQSDYEGHRGSNDFPHYHIQMLIDNKIFIKFADLHIPFDDEDLFYFQAINEAPDLFKYDEGYGSSIERVLKDLPEEELLNTLKVAPDKSKEAVHITTLIESEESPISREVLQSIIDEHKRTGVPMARLFQKYKGTKSTIIISPGIAIPEKKVRPKRK